MSDLDHTLDLNLHVSYGVSNISVSVKIDPL